MDIIDTAEPPQTERPRPFGKLWPFLRYAFLISIVLEVLYGGSSLDAWFVLSKINNGEAVPLGRTTYVDLHQAIFGGLYLVIYIVAAVAFARFYYRAMRNLTLIGAAGLETSPFWSIGYYFVPVMNLWMPYSAICQIWRGSHDPAKADVNIPSFVGWWWFFWLTTNLLGNISFRLLKDAGSFGDQIGNMDLYLVSLVIDVFNAPIGVVAAALVLRFTPMIMSAQIKNVLNAPVQSSTVAPAS